MPEGSASDCRPPMGFYNRSFHYDYKAEESELRDRITFRDNYIKESKTQKRITAENLNVNNNVIGTTTY